MAEKKKKAGPEGLVNALLEDDGVADRVQVLLERWFAPEHFERVTRHPEYPRLVFELAARENDAAAVTARVIRANLSSVGELE